MTLQIGFLLRQPSVACHGDQAVARRPARHARAHRLDHARYLATGCERAWWLELISVLDHQYVEIVYRTGQHTDAQLPLPWF